MVLHSFVFFDYATVSYRIREETSKISFSFVKADWQYSKGAKPDCLWKLKLKPWT